MGVVAMLFKWPRPFEHFSFPWPLEDTYEIWLQLVQWFQRRSHLKFLTDDNDTEDDNLPVPKAPQSL